MKESTGSETTLELLGRFREVNNTYPGTAGIKSAKLAGTKVFGWICTYVPEELIHAAGGLPVRISGYQQETELDDANAHSLSCWKTADIIDSRRRVGVKKCD
jgi:benzoyl-CoA reductase/2-hydroxyglutaryl-CoA dehydratase subunit BcrC/BadD/HgdB